ncbi:uncharacterized protein LOC143172833 [Aptenodytes patagonicus]|uniref:uncharacterized protein LOC143172833 n=1 Tax=Aptenodytes patagonicus TaxID=9234 RepID=UPI003FA07749
MGGLKLLGLNSICCSVPAAASRRPRAALPLLLLEVVLTQAGCRTNIGSLVSRKHASIPAPVPSSVLRKPKSWKALACKVLTIGVARAKEVLKGHVYLSPIGTVVFWGKGVPIIICPAYASDCQQWDAGLNYRVKDANSDCTILYLKVRT